jgi:hypothetical protein
MKELVKTVITLAAALGIAGNALAEGGPKVCGPQTLNGSYVFNTHGFNIVNGASVPKAILQGIQFNGDGTLVTTFLTASINGVIIRASGTTGTYTLAADCTGTITFADGASYDTYSPPNGRQMILNQTSGPAGGLAVMEGKAVKVTP